MPLPSAHTIDRARLVPLIDHRPVVVLAGMAGYGKSTLLAAASRRQQVNGAAIWLDVDDSDRSPVRLVADLITAVGLSGLEELGANLEPLRASALRAEPLTLVDSLLEVLYDAALPLTLVLDDLQDLTGSRGSIQIIDHILKWAPANMRIAVAARVVPPLRLQRLRLDDRLAYLTHEQLAFGPQETAEAVRAAGLDLDAETVEGIHRATGGWPAGVRMAILASRQYGLRKQVPTQLRRDQALAEYLATEVLASLSDDLRDFVLDATLDEHVCPSLVDSVRGTHNAEALLEQCVADGLFLSRGGTNAEEAWYYWHPLFAAHIHRRLVADYPERATVQHAAAADWWSNVDAPTAIRHAVAAGDGERASRIFADRWLELFLEGRVDAVLDAVDQVPEGSAYSADTHLARALVLVQRGKMDDAQVQIDAAHDAAVLLPSEAKAVFEDRLAVVQLFRTGYGLGLSAAVEPGAALLERFDRSQRPPDPAVLASVQMFVGMGEARLQAEPAPTLEMLRSSAATARDTGLLALELTALAESCLPAIVEERLDEVRDLAISVLARADDRGWVGLATLAPAVAFLGWLDYWRGNVHEARAQLERALSMMLPFDWELRGLTLNYLTKACLALGDLVGAKRAIAQVRAVMDSGRRAPGWPSMLSGLEGLALIAEGRTREAVALASAPMSEPEYPLARAHRAKVLIQAGRPAEALAELDRTTSTGRLVQVECLSRCLEAEARAELGRPDAHASLEAALAAAEPDELYGPFLRVGERLPDLLKAHLRHGTAHPAAVTQVLGRIAAGQRQETTGRGEQLTEREHVILRYLATNLTNAEIAEAEYISLHTAKTHIAHIYQKLGVSSRRAAIRRAAELELY
ncbi:LuxR C-terminal-related transcriptional regulator [Intrasporangium sp. YIM S08009]|uniref:LuxR C-terminal-related transcriptional regulator n=1 Tax=Intrasporangium zincisolvens TaxID=3080018 RepID=UPI002B057CC1|nr:LuxR C-terminal-related transcriptional regulator [Intrasporangium sp. YIM S08009]